jgi:1-acyl-sn-glycerol-3-phosphate acyltransferase
MGFIMMSLMSLMVIGQREQKMVINEDVRGQFRVSSYDHTRYTQRRKILRFLIRYIGIPLLAKVDSVEGQENIPKTGAAILMINHISFIDPIVILPFLERDIVPLAKIEVYNYPVVGIFPRIWGVVPVRREEVDRRAIQQSLEVLRAGETILVAPEGTRGDELKRGKEGIAYLASRGDAVIVPTAIEGTRGFPALRGSSRWRRPGAQFRFGTPFRFRSQFRRAGGEQLRCMTDEAMYILASLLTPERRGYYSDLSKSSLTTIEFL